MVLARVTLTTLGSQGQRGVISHTRQRIFALTLSLPPAVSDALMTMDLVNGATMHNHVHMNPNLTVTEWVAGQKVSIGTIANDTIAFASHDVTITNMIIDHMSGARIL